MSAPERTSSAPLITCGGCSARWTRTAIAHCAGCHLTFSGLTLFDRHRSPAGAHGVCQDPATLTDKAGKPVCELRDGVWSFPEMSDEQKAAAFGSAR